MNEAAKEARRIYKRNWQRANPDKVRRYQENYWTRKAEAAAGTTDGGGTDQETETTTNTKGASENE